VTTAAQVTEIAFWHDVETDTLHFETPIKDAHHDVTYERKTRPKIINGTPLRSSSLATTANQALRQFDVLLAVDTNTRVIEQRNVSVSGLVLGTWVTDSANSSLAVSYHTPFCLEFVECNEPRERMGWFMAFRELRRRGHLPRDANTALIVDAYLDDLPAINARRRPVVGSFLLPYGLTLLYASSDVGAEYAVNKLLRAADRVSTRVLDHMMVGGVPPNTKVLAGRPYQGYRVIFGKQLEHG
jgi:hypothetical protein